MVSSRVTIQLVISAFLTGLLFNFTWFAGIPAVLILSAIVGITTDEEEFPKKLPELPRRAFFFWFNENRNRIKKPGMSVLDVRIQAGNEWEALEDKSKWETMASADMKRYAHEMAVFNAAQIDFSAADTAAPTRVRAKKDRNAPWRAGSAYMFWLKDNRARITKPGMSVFEVSTRAGIEWNAVEDKSKWEKMAVEDKKRYQTEMAAYKTSHSRKSY